MRGARKAFDRFPQTVRDDIATALAIAAAGEKADVAKPMRGLGAGVFEIALKHRGDAYRAVYAARIGNTLWVIHAFQKKSTSGIATPKHEIDLIKRRLRHIQENG